MFFFCYKKIRIISQLRFSHPGNTYLYCPFAMPAIIIPIQADATSPVPTWKSEEDVGAWCTHRDVKGGGVKGVPCC